MRQLQTVSSVTELVQNWITKAEHDLKIAGSELKTEEPAHDMICYHFQQCAEKYLKAWLIATGVEPRRTHNIHILLEQCAAQEPEFSILIDKDTGSLTVYATDTRYPDDFFMPSVEETASALANVTLIKEFVSARLQIIRK